MDKSWIGVLSALLATVLLFFVGRLFGPKNTSSPSIPPPPTPPRDTVRDTVVRELEIEKQAREEKERADEKLAQEQKEREERVEKEHASLTTPKQVADYLKDVGERTRR